VTPEAVIEIAQQAMRTVVFVAGPMLVAGIMESEVELVGAYVDAAAHTTFLVLDASSAVEIEEALAPVIDIGWHGSDVKNVVLGVRIPD